MIHIGKKTTLRLMCPQTQAFSEIFSCFKMISVAIFAHHLVRMQKSKYAQYLLFSLLSYHSLICSSITAI
uniref:Uncharacterized protein n=1 Tax=Cyanistes caeruleus TaxID=156563 RepID=A0A8C0V0L6_CYACU